MRAHTSIYLIKQTYLHCMSTVFCVKEGKEIISMAKKRSVPKPDGGQVIFSVEIH